MKNFYLVLLLLFSAGVSAQTKPSLINLVSEDGRNYYYKMNLDSFSTDFELAYFRSLVFKNNFVVIMDANVDAASQLYKTSKSLGMDAMLSEIRKMKVNSFEANAKMSKNEKDHWSTGNLKD